MPLTLQLIFLGVDFDIFQEQLKLACPFLTTRSILWPSGGLMRTIGEKIVKTASTFSARKKSPDSIFLIFFFENKFLKGVKIYKKNVKGLGAL